MCTNASPSLSLQTDPSLYPPVQSGQLLPRCTNNSDVCWGVTRVLAQRMPEAATAGTPIPGMVLSPTRYNPEMGVWEPGNIPLPAAIAGPYVPLYRRR